MPEDTHAAPGSPPIDLLATLANARRRRALRSLNRSSPRALSVLARDVAETEAAENGRADAGATADRVELDLYHCQVPALADAGLVRYDDDDGTVAITPEGSAVADWLCEKADATQPVGCD